MGQAESQPEQPPVGSDDPELTGGMRADGGSIVSVHGDAPIVRSGDEDAELRALLDLPTFEPMTKVEKAGMFGTDKYLLHAEVSPVALAEVAEAYQQWFAAKAQKVSAQQAQLGGDMQMAESNSRIMYQELNDLKKEAAVASTKLSTEVSQVTKDMIEVQKRMEDLIQSADNVGTKLNTLDRGGTTEQIPSFSEFMAAQRAAGRGGTEGQVASPRISHRD